MKKEIHCMCVNYLNLKHWISNCFFVGKQMCALEWWLFSGTELLAII